MASPDDGEPPAAPAVPGRKLTIESLPRELLFLIIDYYLCDEPKSVIHYPLPIPNIRNLSLVSKKLREVCIPKLFAVLNIEGPEYELHTTFEQVAASAEIVSAVRSISIEPVNRPESIFSDEPLRCHESFPAAMFQLLGTLSNLVDVRLVLWHEDTVSSSLRAYCKHHSTSLSHIKSLDILAPTQIDFFLTDIFTDLTTLHVELQSGTAGLKSLGFLKSLTALSLGRNGCPQGFRLSDVKHLQQVAPSIQYLRLVGPWEETTVSSLIDTFAQFPKLEYLAIYCHQVVHPDGSASEADRDVETEQLTMNHPLNENNQTNAEAFFRQCPRLKNLTFFGLFDDAPYARVGTGEDVVFQNIHCIDEASGVYWDGCLPAVF